MLGFQRWDAIAAELPSLVARLETLRVVHEQAVAVVGDVEKMDADNGAITALLTTANSSAASVETAFVQNMATVQENMQHIEQRIDSIQQKMA